MCVCAFLSVLNTMVISFVTLNVSFINRVLPVLVKCRQFVSDCFMK